MNKIVRKRVMNKKIKNIVEALKKFYPDVGEKILLEWANLLLSVDSLTKEELKNLFFEKVERMNNIDLPSIYA